MSDEHDQVGDTTQASAEPNAADEQKQTLTLDQVTDVVSKMVNNAITNRNKQLEAKLEKLLSEKLAPKTEESSAPKTESTSTSPAPAQSNAEIEAMRKELEKVNKRLREAEKEKAMEAERARDAALRAKMSDELVKSGIDAARVKHAVGHLLDVEKRVRYDESGELVFRDTEDQDVDLKSGIKDWLKTEDAKIYMPPRGATGTGERRPQGKAPGGKTDPVEEVGNLIVDMFKRGEL